MKNSKATKSCSFVCDWKRLVFFFHSGRSQLYEATTNGFQFVVNQHYATNAAVGNGKCLSRLCACKNTIFQPTFYRTVPQWSGSATCTTGYVSWRQRGFGRIVRKRLSNYMSYCLVSWGSLLHQVWLRKQQWRWEDNKTVTCTVTVLWCSVC